MNGTDKNEAGKNGKNGGAGNPGTNLMPKIRRAREYRLYDFNGRRYLDLCLDGGRALLGHKPGRVVLMMKNALEKGLGAAYPGVWEDRLLRQLKAVYPEIAAISVVFAGSAAAAASEASGGGVMPLVRPFDNDGSLLPLPCDAPFELLLPMPGSSPVRVLCSAEGAGLKDSALPEPDAVPQYLYSGLCRAAAELAAFRKDADPAVWAAFDSPLWERRGPWLFFRTSGEEYAELFQAFLSRGIIISPDPEIPSVAPYNFTEGEIKPIKEIEQMIMGALSDEY